jgi:ribosomal protein S27AE
MAEIDWKRAPLRVYRPPCTRCKGQGAFRSPHTQRYHLCICGRFLTATMAGKMAEQKRLDERLSELQKKGW